jgi:hypothetical protein
VREIPNFDLYAELEVDPRASVPTIEAAWRSLSKRFHPDVVGTQAAEEHAKRLNIARDWLIDPDLRALYDAQRTPTSPINPDPSAQAEASRRAGGLSTPSSSVVVATKSDLTTAQASATQQGGWVARQFTTRVIALIPVAIAINIVIGYITQNVLKLPVYLDSIGTILVGVLAGPLAGALTGALSNIIWAWVLNVPTIFWFWITAAVIGLLAGLWGYLGVYRPRPASGRQLTAAAIIAAVLVVIIVLPILGNSAYTDPNIGAYPSWVYAAAGSIGVIVALIVAAFVYVRKDLAGLFVALAGIATGIVAAIVSAPIAAIVYGGVTGSGTDLIVLALRQGGSDVLQASLGQGLFSDPIDKTITSFVVYIILLSLSPRVIARFPLGDRLIPQTSQPADAMGAQPAG